MKKITVILTAVLAIWASDIYAQTNTNPVTKNVELNSLFNEIKSSTGIAVKYNIISDKEKAHATISADRNTIDYISVAVKDETLRINFKNLDNSNNNNNAIMSPTVYVYAPAVNSLSASSGSIIFVENNINIKGLNMNLKASSGGQIRIKDIKCNSVNTSLSSGSIVAINNTSAEKLNVSNSSGSQTRISKVSAPVINIKTSSGSTVNIDGVSSKLINVDASSASIVNMSGKAESITIDASSASNVVTSELSCKTANVTASSTASVDVKAKDINESTSSYARVNKH